MTSRTAASSAPRDIRDHSPSTSAFGCEAEDPSVALGLDGRALPLGARLNAMFGSDIGHWDVHDPTPWSPTRIRTVVQMMTKRVRIVEATVRDGGYMVDHQFLRTDLAAIVGGLDRAGIVLIEVGHCR
jgi:hypothetical protein